MASGGQSSAAGSFEQLATGGLLRRLIGDLKALAQKQVLLARQEAEQGLHQATAGGKLLAIGAVFLLAAFVALVALIISLLGLVLPLWLAALVVLVVCGVVGGILASIGFTRLRVQPLPETRQTLREEVTWARQLLRPGER